MINLSKEQDQSTLFFTLHHLPPTVQDKVLPLAQLLNVENIDLRELKPLIARGIPDQATTIRKYAWKLMLGALPRERRLWQTRLQNQNKLYKSFLSEFLNEDKYKQSPITIAKHDSRWSSFESDHNLWQQIEKDTCRTQAQLSFFSSVAQPLQLPFFTNTRRQKYKLISGRENLADLTHQERRVTYNYDYMTRILFIFARLNPKVAYVQGMNELLAPIFYLVNSGENQRSSVQEATCFFMFNNVMSDILEMHMRDFSKTENPIHSRIRHINVMLLALEPKIWQKLETLNIQPFYYCFRWITLLFSQEYQLFQTLRIWQSIFSYEDRKTYTNFLAVSLLMSSADAIAAGDYSQIMAYLKVINQYVKVEDMIRRADTLYAKYARVDLTELADKNMKKLQQDKKGGVLRFLKKLF